MNISARILTGEKLMCKRFITILIAFLSVLMLAGCRSSKPDLEVMPHDDNTITIKALSVTLDLSVVEGQNV